MHDLALLLGRLLQFGGFIIVQPAAQNLQDFAGEFSSRANDKDTPELLFIFAITPFQRQFYGFIGRCRLSLFLLGPNRRLWRGSFFCVRFADSRMAPEGLEPAGLPKFLLDSV